MTPITNDVRESLAFKYGFISGVLEKEANFITDLKDKMEMTDYNALIGAAGGAGIGGLSGALFAEKGKRLPSALLGGLGGGVVGGIAGGMYGGQSDPLVGAGLVGAGIGGGAAAAFSPEGSKLQSGLLGALGGGSLGLLGSQFAAGAPPKGDEEELNNDPNAAKTHDLLIADPGTGKVDITKSLLGYKSLEDVKKATAELPEDVTINGKTYTKEVVGKMFLQKARRHASPEFALTESVDGKIHPSIRGRMPWYTADVPDARFTGIIKLKDGTSISYKQPGPGFDPIGKWTDFVFGQK